MDMKDAKTEFQEELFSQTFNSNYSKIFGYLEKISYSIRKRGCKINL